MKEVRFVGSSLSDLAAFPTEARRAAGFELWQVQCGLMPSDFKPMLNVGSGAYEIRIKTGGQYRVIYVARFADIVYVLHAFRKKSQKTPQSDIEIAHQRYTQVRKGK